MRVGFVGIGMMGKPMVLNLGAKGHAVTVYDQSQEAVATVAGTEGVTVAPTLADAVRDAEVVITMLPNGQIVRKVAEAAAEHMADGAVLVDMSTSYPLETTELRKALPDRIALVDAPVSGGVRRAVSGTLTIITGGAAADIDRAEPVLSAMGNVQRTGALGSGHAMKVLNNYLSASGLAAACEAVLVGQKFGLDPDVMADVFNTSTGKNNATEVKLKQQVNNRSFAAGFTMELMAKDLALAARLAKDMEVGAEGLDACATLFRRAVEELGPAEDHTAIMKLIEGQPG